MASVSYKLAVLLVSWQLVCDCMACVQASSPEIVRMQELRPGGDGVTSEIMSAEQLDRGSPTFSMRLAFSHSSKPPLPLRILEKVCTAMQQHVTVPGRSRDCANFVHLGQDQSGRMHIC